MDDLKVGGEVIHISVPYRGSTLTVRIELHGQSLTRATVAKVRRYLEMITEDIQDPDLIAEDADGS